MNYATSLSAAKDNLSQQITGLWKSATGVGAADLPALIPPNLSSAMTNMIQFLNPFNAKIKPLSFTSEKGYNGVTMKYPRITALRAPGNFAGEKADGQYSNPTLDQGEIDIKAKKSRFKIWNLGKKAADGYIDMISTVLATEAVAFSVDTAMGYIYDNAVLNKTWVGGSDLSIGGWENSIMQSIQTNRINCANTSTGAPQKPVDTTIFEDGYVNSLENGGDGHERAWFMSARMASLLTRIAPADSFRLVQNIGDKPGGPDDGSGSPFDIHLGRWPRTLFNIPIYITSFFGGGRNVGTTLDTMTSLSLGTASTGGSMSDGTYYFQVSKIIRALNPTSPSFVGRSMASAAASITISGGTATQKITIGIAGDANAYWYAVYACTTGLQQDYRLVGYLPAKTYNSDGEYTGLVTSLVINTITPDPVLGIPAQGVFGTMQNDVPPISTLGVNEEMVLLLDLDELQGFGTFRFLDESADKQFGFATLKDVTPSARSEYWEWLLYSYGTPVCRYERPSTLWTGLRAR